MSTSPVAGRDLLQTHFATAADGVRLERTEWAPVLCSPPVARAQLLELAALARGIAVNGVEVALAPGWRGAPEARRRLNTACQWLWTVSSSVRAAYEQEPVADIYRELLRAIPAGALPSRVLPGADESVPGLCLGIGATSERVRRAAWVSKSEAVSSPAMSVTSLRQTAAACTVTSHNCEVVLTSLAVRGDMPMSGRVLETLRTAAAAAGRARSGWLQTARALHKVTTDTRGYVSWPAAESSDLALWTGRLAYADPDWTPTSGPTRDVRDPRTLGSGPADIAGIVAAVHQSCHALGSLATADRQQMRVASGVGRILVPTRSLSDSFDIPCLFVAAPPDRICSLLADYGGAWTASNEAAAAVGRVAEAVHAPSRVLTAAADAINHGPRIGASDARGRTRQAFADDCYEPPGPLERILRDLQITNPELVERAAAIDRAGDRLIIDAAEQAQPHGRRARTIADLSTCVGTASIANHALAVGGTRVAAVLRPAQHEVPQREP